MVQIDIISGVEFWGCRERIPHVVALLACLTSMAWQPWPRYAERNRLSSGEDVEQAGMP